MLKITGSEAAEFIVVSNIVPEIIHIVKIEVKSQTKLSSSPNLLTIKMHSMPTRRKIAYTHKH